jgi:hypothetical protein
MDCIEGAVDLHVHSSPDVEPRRFDDIELAREAARAGMAAILIKSHQNSTVERAYLVSRVVSGIQVFGGVVLNYPSGGLNVDAVRVALALGARQIWMPTRDSRNHRRFHGQPGGISVCDADGQLVPEAEEICRMLAATDCILGTGHLDPHEGMVLVERALEMGIRRIVVTHPEWAATRYTVASQMELAKRGVFFERCFVSTTHRCGFTPFSELFDAAAQVGCSTTVLSTDLGQPDTPAPVEGMREYARQLRAYGFDATDIHRMIAENPAYLLGLASRDPAGG